MDPFQDEFDVTRAKSTTSKDFANRVVTLLSLVGSALCAVFMIVRLNNFGVGQIGSDTWISAFHEDLARETNNQLKLMEQQLEEQKTALQNFSEQLAAIEAEKAKSITHKKQSTEAASGHPKMEQPNNTAPGFGSYPKPF